MNTPGTGDDTSESGDAHGVDGAGGSDDVVTALQSIYDVTTDSGLSFDEKIDRLLAIGAEELDLPYGFLSQITVEDMQAETGVQTIRRATGDHELLQPGQSAPLSNAYCRKTIQSDSLLAIQHAIEEGWEGDPAHETYELGSYIGGKVEVEEELHGTFCFASTEAREQGFSPEERTFVQVLSKWASYELEQEQAKRDLEQQRDDLELLSTIVRHDIRNDLQLILAYTEMLGEHVDDDGKQYVDQVLQAARDAVDITTTAGEVAEVMLQEHVDQSPMRLRHGLEAAVNEVRASNQQARVTIDGPLPDVSVRTDDMLESVFRNLLKNAIYHNDKPVPEVIVGATKTGDTVTVTIADNGPGIPDDRKAAIFEEGEMGLDSQGTGLGLYLVDTLVDRFGGSVSVEDNDPVGAVFVVELPLVET
jgi:signal transduction histidine kinase